MLYDTEIIVEYIYYKVRIQEPTEPARVLNADSKTATPAKIPAQPNKGECEERRSFLRAAETPERLFGEANVVTAPRKSILSRRDAPPAAVKDEDIAFIPAFYTARFFMDTFDKLSPFEIHNWPCLLDEEAEECKSNPVMSGASRALAMFVRKETQHVHWCVSE